MMAMWCHVRGGLWAPLSGMGSLGEAPADRVREWYLAVEGGPFFDARGGGGGAWLWSKAPLDLVFGIIFETQAGVAAHRVEGGLAGFVSFVTQLGRWLAYKLMYDWVKMVRCVASRQPRPSLPLRQRSDTDVLTSGYQA